MIPTALPNTASLSQWRFAGKRDTATYEDPRRLPEGVPYVIVNGVVVVDDGRHTGALAGRTLRASRMRSSASSRISP